jgi:isopenicillin-N epimerase
MNPEQHEMLQEYFLLDPQVIYLNHGSFGATPLPVFERYQAWQRELERQPTAFLGREKDRLLKASRAVLAQYLCTDAKNLVYVTNATVGLNIVARGLRLGPGEEVLSTDHEYGALDRTWRFHAQKQGFKYINHPVAVPVSSTQEFVEQFWQGVTPNTRVIFLSHITSPTALIFPVQEICRRARSAGILTIVDGAHIPGQLPLNLDALGADFYSGNLHKWLCAPKGAAFLYARPEVQDMIEPLVVSWGWQNEFPVEGPLVDFNEWQGTRDISSFLSVPDAILFQEQHHWPAVRARCHDLAAYALCRITEMFGTQPLSPISPVWFAQMVSAPLPANTDPGALHQRLLDEYSIEIPVISWNNRVLTRISVQGYNTPEHIERLLQALAACV